MKVEGKVALVTGGARGIGKGVCELLLEKGAKGISIVDYNKVNGEKTEAEFSKKYGTGKATFLHADVTTDQLEDAFKKTKDVYGRLDIVMNNAGIADETNLQRMISINLIAVITGTQLALKIHGQV
ncbi:PREDICTED: 15-hydroxyprostaglandin dehydrogenase [NAD(+)]-like isoform X1 [Priapulus caudatus]|uniref:15-hydroxyprostaglandin dehydrogenase [NAD(+)] n=1 Tax=Priapulus caudatus TaxID=37621 RepID=A0ABM1EQ19_PRICU|nr:PREDICTED: 15-hydroxyprostaglandin dehydrogenase [NAD(+)]-like isoform X1 [Priapulus caudatus]